MGANVAGLPLAYFDHTGTAVALTGTTSETVLATINLPAGIMGPQGFLEMLSFWSVTNNANVKTCRLRLNGLAGSSFGAPAPTSNASMVTMNWIQNRNSTASQIGGFSSTVGYGVSTSALNTSTVDMSVDVPLVITGQLAVGTDTLTLEGWTLKIWKPT